jgi:hypothetical protein
MDTMENRSVDQTELQELRTECQTLRQIVSALLVLVLLVTGALDIYLLRQWRMARAELQRRGPQITQFVAEYNRVSAPAIADFVKRLVDFSKTHPDFGPILARYNIKGDLATGAQPASVTPAKK